MKQFLKRLIVLCLISSFIFNSVSSAILLVADFEKSNIYMVSSYPGSRPYCTAFSASYNDKTYVVTNNHCCEVDNNAFIWIRNEYRDSWHKAETLTRDPEHDLCILTSDSIDSGLKLGENGGWLKESVRIIGHPLMQPLTSSTGQINEISPVGLEAQDQSEESCNKHWNKWEELNMFGIPMKVCTEVRESYITNALALPGNSGSPVFNSSNQVVGILYAAGPGEGLYIGVQHLIKLLDWLQKPREQAVDPLNR